MDDLDRTEGLMERVRGIMATVARQIWQEAGGAPGEEPFLTIRPVGEEHSVWGDCCTTWPWEASGVVRIPADVLAERFCRACGDSLDVMATGGYVNVRYTQEDLEALLARLAAYYTGVYRPERLLPEGAEGEAYTLWFGYNAVWQRREGPWCGEERWDEEVRRLAVLLAQWEGGTRGSAGRLAERFLERIRAMGGRPVPRLLWLSCGAVCQIELRRLYKGI